MNDSGKTKNQKMEKRAYQRQKAMRQGRQAPVVLIAHLLLSVKFMSQSLCRILPEANSLPQARSLL
jgi:hypothetical protein